MGKTTMTFFLASALGAVLLLSGAAVHAGEDSARETVEQLLPRLQSADDAVRARAESELFRLGEPGRREMERLSRDLDTRRAVTALRLLQSDRWPDPVLHEGEQPMRRLGGGEGADGLADLQNDIERRFAEMQEQIERALRGLPRLRLPDLPEIDLGEPGEPGGRGAVTLAGTVIRGDRKLTWHLAADGKVRVTTQNGDGVEQVFEADDMDAFRSAYPEVAQELDEVAPTWIGAPTVRFWDSVPEFRVPPRLWRWWHDEDVALPGDEKGLGTPVPKGPLLGIEWGPVSPLLRHHLRLGDVGVVVESVLPGTTAAGLRMEPMDVLVELAGKPIRDRRDIGAALRDAGDTPVDAVVIRRGERRTLRYPE